MFPFIGIGNISHDIDLTVFKLIKTVGPVTFHILKLPSGIACQSLHEFVAEAASNPVLINIIEGILKGTDTDDLLPVIILRLSSPAMYRK